MKYCPKCGAQLRDDAAFCPGCGTPVNSAPIQPEVLNTPGSDVQSNRGIAWLAYCGLLLLVPLFARKRSPYCRFHVKQGATLLAVEIAYFTVTQIMLAIINAIFPGSWEYLYLTRIYVHSAPYNVFNILFSLGYIFITVLCIMGIVNAATGKQKKLPLIGEIPFVEMLMDKIYAALNK